MLSSEDEQDDNGIYDQLKSIKPFTVDQLYLLHPDVGCPPKYEPNLSAQSELDVYHDRELYQNLIEFEQLRQELSELKGRVKQLYTKTFEHVNSVWVLKDESTRRIGICQQGKIAETTFKYKQAFLSSKELNTFNKSFSDLIDIINKEFMYYSFESQMKRHKIATKLSISYQEEDPSERSAKLKTAIATLIDFIKHLGDSKSDFGSLCRKWLRCLIKRYLEDETTENCKFIISQLSKGPSGTADWSADLIECKPYEQVSHLYESEPKYMSHCSALLNQLFVNLKVKLSKVSSNQHPDQVVTTKTPSNEQNWSLIDPRFNCAEELNLSSCNVNILSECDVIKLSSKIPVAQIFRAYVKKCLSSNEFRLETDKNYEYIMLKLLTLGTIIIRTYQVGLETFNSIQYGNLIEYLSSQIRRTVIVLSDQWTEFKRRLKGVDNALLMRLQVEYDNFILRSILIILELRQSGIWRHLCQTEQNSPEDHEAPYSWSAESLRPTLYKLLEVTGISSPIATNVHETATPPSQSTSQPSVDFDSRQSQRKKFISNQPLSSSLTYEFSTEWFKEVSEPMLWHILWQFYHNAFTSSCDYHSGNYWLQKFHEKSVVFLFVNKIRDSSIGECNYLLNSLTSIVLSRTQQDSKIIDFIATEIFNLTFRHSSTKEKVAKKGIRSLIRCAERFPHLISLYLGYMVDENLDDGIVDLVKHCSLSGWLCNEEEVDMIANWLVEYPLLSVNNKVARLLISKLLLNSPDKKFTETNDANQRRISQTRRKKMIKNCYVDLKLRRRLALLLFEACVRHHPKESEISPKSLGASVEVAFGGLYCEKGLTSENNFIELAMDSNYNQLYVWSWRLLFTLRLHILDQHETDWNDVHGRSGTSRSINNTVLFDDSFHLVPNIQDCECLTLAEGLKNENPMASFLYLFMTDATWKIDKLDNCLDHLNIMSKLGHLTPSLMAMKYLTICHLNNLSDYMCKNSKCFEYFRTIILSNFDTARLASLVISQLDRLKQSKQLQLSQFYIKVFIEVATILDKQVASSWFSGHEYSLEKIACFLDYLVKFNFVTQRSEIIRKFYDCSYSVQASVGTGSWFGSMFASNSLNATATRREFLTTLHVLTQKYKKYTWLRWVTTECDSLRLEKIWEDLVVYLSYNEESNLDAAMKKVCPQVNPTILKSMLPIYSWIKQIFDIMETELSHPLCPLIWYNFFLNYFANSLNGVSVGIKLVPTETLNKLMSRLDSLFNYHLYKQRNWSTPATIHQNSLALLYKAYRLWLQDPSLRDAYVDIDRLKEDYLVPLLKAVMECSTEEACLQYIDIQSIETQNKNLIQVWSTAARLDGNHLIKDMVFVESNQDNSMEILTSVDDEASDATSLIAKIPYNLNLDNQNKSMITSDDELKVIQQEPLTDAYRTLDEVLELVKKNFHTLFDESSMFTGNLGELDKNKNEIEDLLRDLYTNKKREMVRVVPCIEGSECPGPARIKFEVEEASMDERKSQCIQDRGRQCEEIVTELLSMPSFRIIKCTVVIEENINQLVQDPSRSKDVIEVILKWISENKSYEQLSGDYYPANHLLKTVLEILSASQHIDTYNTTLVDVCFDHPGSVQIFSPFLSPSACSADTFLSLYKKVGQKHSVLGPPALFVILSKFDINHWLRKVDNKQTRHELIKATCLALKSMGKQPDESFVLTFELYKRHLNIELAEHDRRKPEEITLVLSQFLHYMNSQALCPSLWLDFMSILGLEKNLSPKERSNMTADNISRSTVSSFARSSYRENSNVANQSIGDLEHSDLVDVIGDIARLAESQTVLDYHSLNHIMKMLVDFTAEAKLIVDITLIEFYQDYLNEFSILMLSATFVWLKSVSDLYPDNHEMIWNQFIDVWYDWVFLTKSCQNVGKVSYNLIANNFVASIKFMIQKIPDNTRDILKSVLRTLTDYVTKTKEVVYLELTILQRCLKKLPWSSFVASPEDMANLATLSEQENYNLSDLVSHIMMHMDLKESLSKIHEETVELLPLVAQQLATIIIIQSNQLKGFRLFGGYFSLIPVDSVTRLSAVILSRLEFVNLEHSQTNKLLVNLLRLMCIKFDLGDSNTQDEVHIGDDLDRSIIYADFVSNYLIDLIKNHPTVMQHHQEYLNAIMENSMQDLKLLVSPDVDLAKKTQIYGSLFECCNCDSLNTESRMFIARTILNSSIVKNRPIVVLEIFHALGKIIRDGQILVYTIEQMISLYLSMNGHYEKILKSFSLRVIPSDLYLNACIEDNAPLALLVYFESLYRNGLPHSVQESKMSESATSIANPNNTKIWSSFFHWISQLTVANPDSGSKTSRGVSMLTNNETKLAIAWLRVIDLLESDLQQFIFNDKVTSGDNTQASDHKSDTQSLVSQSASTNGSITTQQGTSTKQIVLISSHRSLINFIKHLISIYDSNNSGGLWSYLKYSKNNEGSKISIVALSIACLLADRTLICLGGATSDDLSSRHINAMREEVCKARKNSLAKLDNSRKSKVYQDHAHFIEALIESVNRNDKVQYSEGVQLITTFVKRVFADQSSQEDIVCMNKILPSFN